MFHLVTSFHPQGDQPKAIKKIVSGIKKGQKEQVLLGATGTGKTFTMANVIQAIQKPTLILAHNKTLAMQIYQEMQGFFPNNRVEYYVSYFDYYQPEAYKPASDIYIGKKVQRNSSIAKMRLKTLNSLVTDNSVIVIASVAAIYGCFNPDSYRKVVVHLEKNQEISKEFIKAKLVHLGYKEDKKIDAGNFQINKKNICFMIGWEENYYLQINLVNDKIQTIEKRNKQTSEKEEEISRSVKAYEQQINKLKKASEEIEYYISSLHTKLEDYEKVNHASLSKIGELEQELGQTKNKLQNQKNSS